MHNCVSCHHESPYGKGRSRVPLPSNIRDQQIILERARGDTLEAIGERHGVSYQRVQMIVRETRHAIDRLELELLKARKTGEAIGLAIPNQDQADRQLALSYFGWCVEQLRSRDVQVAVETRQTPAGVVLFISDVTNYGGSK
jgi:hypothetical protein